MKLLEHTEGKFHGLYNNSMAIAPKAQRIRAKSNKWDYIKLKVSEGDN